MSGSTKRGEKRLRQMEDEKTGGAEALEASGSGFPPPAQVKTPRRRVQTKLNFIVPAKGRGRGQGGGGMEGDGESPSSGDEGKRKPKRKKKAQPRTPTKVSTIAKEDIGFNSTSKMLPTSNDGSDFFVKISEKRLKRKYQREQEDVVDLTLEDDTCSKALQVIGKDCMLRSGPKAKLRRSGTTSAAKDTVALDLNRCLLTMDTSSAPKNTEEGNVHAAAPRSVHPFFSRWKTAKTKPEISPTGKVGKNDCSALDDDGLLSCPPIHVFETLQDNAMPLDWGHWKISERSLLELSNSIDAAQGNLLESDVLVTPLKFDGTVRFLNPSGDVIPDGKPHVVHIPEAKYQCEGTKSTSASLTDMQEPHNQHDSHINMLEDPKENTLSCRCTSDLDNLVNKQQYQPYQERKRPMGALLSAAVTLHFCQQQNRALEGGKGHQLIFLTSHSTSFTMIVGLAVACGQISISLAKL